MRSIWKMPVGALVHPAVRPLAERGQDDAEEADSRSMAPLDDRPPVPSPKGLGSTDIRPTNERRDRATSSDAKSLPPAGFTTSGDAFAKPTREPDRSREEETAGIVQDGPDLRAAVARAIVEHLDGRGRVLDGVAAGCEHMDRFNPVAALGCLFTGGGAINSRSLDIRVSDITVHACDDVSERFGRGHMACRWSGQVSAGMNDPMAQLLAGAASLGVKSHLFLDTGRGRYTLVRELR